nr:bifunctional chorismate mutase/prephenate dehydrogenase T-protein [Tanacetum cinerariifolium]
MIKQGHLISATSRSYHYAIAGNLGVHFIRHMEEFLGLEHDVILICTSIMSLSEVVKSIPFHCLKRPTLFADVLSIKEHPRQILLQIGDNHDTSRTKTMTITFYHGLSVCSLHVTYKGIHKTYPLDDNKLLELALKD